MMTRKIVDTFQDKIDVINKLIQEFQLKPRFGVVVYVEEGLSPGYLIESEVMQFALSIGEELEIDDYISGFVENEINHE